MSEKKRILITNDDGIYGPGLEPLRESLASLGELFIVVPDQEKSTASHSLTIHKPLRSKEISDRFYILSGTPADCVRFGILHLLRRKVDLVVAGINSGVNLGEDVIYSGTVACAVEAAMLDVPAIALSQPPSQDSKKFVPGAQFARRLARLVLKRGLPKGVCLNVNIPIDRHDSSRNIRGAKVTHLGHRLYGKKVTIHRDPRGHQYYWLLGRHVVGVPTPGSDVEAYDQGYITVTPIQLDWTAHHFIEALESWSF